MSSRRMTVDPDRPVETYMTKKLGEFVMIRAVSAVALTLVALSPAWAAKKEVGQMTEKGVLTMYEGQKYEGESIEVNKDMPSLSYDFTIGSVGIYPGDKWELCEQTRFRGNCNVMTANEKALGRIKIQSARIVKPPAATAPAM